MAAFEAESEAQTEGSVTRRREEPSPLGAMDADAVTPIPVGDLVSGRWVVDGVLGHGAMGVVCAAHHVDLGQRVAVKFLRASFARNEGVVQRFLDEARAAAALRSEHIVRVFDIGQTPSGLPYFVMEYLEGTTLEAKLRREGPVSPERAIDYVLQACDGLREAHAAGIVHRDVKPENLFLASSGGGSKEVVKVVDFGIAKRLDAARAKIVTGPQDRIGSPCYMSPEQMVSPKAVDPRTDVWALGVVLYQSLTGHLPFDGNTLEEMFERIQSADAPPPSTYRPQVDFGLDAVVARCLQKDPNDRYQSIGELAAELERLRSPAEWRSPSFDEQIWQATSRSDVPVSALPRSRPPGASWPVAIAAVLGALVTIGGTVLVWTSRGSAPSPGFAAARAAEPTDVKPAKNPEPALLAPLGAVPAISEQAAAPAEPAEPAVTAEREVKRSPAELAKLRRQGGARGKAAPAKRAAPAPAEAAAPPPPPVAAAPAEPAEPAPHASEDAPPPTGDDSYPEYLKRNGWRPLRDVLSEIERKSPPEPPQGTAPPREEAPPPPPLPAEPPAAPDGKEEPAP